MDEAEMEKCVKRISSVQANLSDAISTLIAGLLSIAPDNLPPRLAAKARHVTHYNGRLRKEIESLKKKIDKMQRKITHS